MSILGGHQERTMTLTEALAVDRRAFWGSDDEEFMFVPASGEILWVSYEGRSGERGQRPGLRFEDLPEGKEVPQTGWYHLRPCRCRFCMGMRRRKASQ